MKYQPKNIIVKNMKIKPDWKQSMPPDEDPFYTIGNPVFLTPQGELSPSITEGKFIGVNVNKSISGPVYQKGQYDIDLNIHGELNNRVSVCWTGQVTIKNGSKPIAAGKAVIIDGDGKFAQLEDGNFPKDNRGKVVGMAVQNIEANSYGDIILTNILINK